MKLKDRLEIFKQKGFSYNPITGEIFSFTGKIMKAKCNNYIYCGLGYNGKVINVYGHQIAFYFIYNKCVKELDHINKNRSDNRIINLRSVTHQKNSFNREAKGYSYNKGKYYSQIQVGKHRINLGLFKYEENAHKAYMEAKSILHKII